MNYIHIYFIQKFIIQEFIIQESGSLYQEKIYYRSF